jgi:hypothetical protein
MDATERAAIRARLTQAGTWLPGPEHGWQPTDEQLLEWDGIRQWREAWDAERRRAVSETLAASGCQTTGEWVERQWREQQRRERCCPTS